MIPENTSDLDLKLVYYAAMSELYKPKVAILASGAGTTAAAFIEATQRQPGIVNAEVGLVICSRPPEQAGIYDRIASLNDQYCLDIDVAHINGRTHPGGPQERGQTTEESEAICDKLDEGGYDHVALMGYMRIVGGKLLHNYGWRTGMDIRDARMSNTHPGRLPETADTYGKGASAEVLRRELAYTEHIVHLVSAGVDEGHILSRLPVDVRHDDTPESLTARVQEVEKTHLVHTLGWFLADQAIYRSSRP